LIEHTRHPASAPPFLDLSLFIPLVTFLHLAPAIFICHRLQKRKAKAVSAAGAAAKEDLLKSSAKKDQELLALEREQADFQAQVEVCWVCNEGRGAFKGEQFAGLKPGRCRGDTRLAERRALLSKRVLFVGAFLPFMVY
jgi:hypothetical protein